MHVTNIIKLSCMFKYCRYMLFMQLTLSNCYACSNIVDICYACNQSLSNCHACSNIVDTCHAFNIVKLSCMFQYCRYMLCINHRYQIVMHVQYCRYMTCMQHYQTVCMFKYCRYTMLCIQPTLSNCHACLNIVDICYACNQHYQIVMHVQIF